MANLLTNTESRLCEVCGRRFSRGRKGKRQFAERKACSRECHLERITGVPRGRVYSTHGMSRSPEFICWWAMRQRCENPRTRHFGDYGGRGISVCPRWHAFEAFFQDMGSRPSAAHSIDRIDVNGDYEPGNCRWATRSEQMRNRRDNVRITIGGETRVLKDWAQHFGISGAAAKARMARGMEPLAAFTMPPNSLPRRSSSGIKGVYEHPQKPRPWQARVQDGGKFKSLGYFATKEEAAEALKRFAVAHGVGVPD